MISDSNEQLQQQLEYTLLKPDCHRWWISKMQSEREEEWYSIKLCFKLGKNDATETYGMLQTVTTPSLSQTIWQRWASTQFLTVPIVQTLLPVTFDYSLSTQAVVETIEEIKEAVTKVIDTLTQEDFLGRCRSCWNGTTRALQPEDILRRGLEFHVCTINKSAHTKKVWKLI